MHFTAIQSPLSLTNQYAFLTHLVESAASLKTNCFNSSDNNPPHHRKQRHWSPAAETHRDGQGFICKYSLSRRQPRAECAAMSGLAQAPPTSASCLATTTTTASNHPRAGGRSGHGSGNRSHCVNVSQPPDQSGRAGTCESVRACVCVCVCVREKEAVTVSKGRQAGSRCSALK